MICNENAFVTGFSGKSGTFIDSIGLTCSDGISMGPYGGSGGGAFTTTSNSGYTGLKVRSGNDVNKIVFLNGNTELSTIGANNGSSRPDLLCPDGKIMGIKTKSDNLLRNITVVCGKYVAS